MWDNAPPNPFIPSLIQRWNDAGRGPRVGYATLDDVRERALGVPEADLPTLRGDWTDYWAFGHGSAPIATALNQRAKPLVAAASALAGEDGDVVRRAIECIDLYDEHTFGYWDTADEHPQTQTIELLKQALAHEGYELASFAVMDGLERLAHNAAADRGVAAVLICNTGPEALIVSPALPAAWFADPERTYQSKSHGSTTAARGKHGLRRTRCSVSSALSSFLPFRGGSSHWTGSHRQRYPGRSRTGSSRRRSRAGRRISLSSRITSVAWGRSSRRSTSCSTNPTRDASSRSSTASGAVSCLRRAPASISFRMCASAQTVCTTAAGTPSTSATSTRRRSTPRAGKTGCRCTIVRRGWSRARSTRGRGRSPSSACSRRRACGTSSSASPFCRPIP